MELAVYAMSYLHEWDEELLGRLLANDNLMDEDMAELVAEDAGSLSFVTKRGDWYQMHERISAMLRSLGPTTRGMRKSFKKYFRNLCFELESIKEKTSLAVEEDRHLRLILARGVWELSKHGKDGYGNLNVDELFKLRCSYVDELKWAGLYEEALLTINEMLSMYQGNLEHELRLYLMQSAQLSQLWIKKGDLLCHLNALEIERHVLKCITDDGVDNHVVLYAMVCNSIGLSLQRIAKTLPDMDESISYLRPNYEAARLKSSGKLTDVETNYLNNYGTACLKAAGLCDTTEKSASYLQTALEAFVHAIDSRETVLGMADARTLRCITNKGIVLARMGRLNDSRTCYETADARFHEAGYGKGHPDWLYNRYHQAILLELEADWAADKGNRVAYHSLLKSAYRTHREVLKDKERCHAGAQSLKKSRERVLLCEEKLCSM